MTPDRLISITAARGLQFGYIAGGGKPEWTAADAAFACKDLPSRMFDALVYTFAGDRSAHSRLRDALANWVRETAWVQRWPGEVTDRADELAEVWLFEVRQPWRFVRRDNSPNPDLRRVLLDVPKHRWQREYSAVYEAVAEEFQAWLRIGASRMRPRLFARDEG